MCTLEVVENIASYVTVIEASLSEWRVHGH